LLSDEILEYLGLPVSGIFSKLVNLHASSILASSLKVQDSGQADRKVAMGHSNRKQWLHPRRGRRPASPSPCATARPKATGAVGTCDSAALAAWLDELTK